MNVSENTMRRMRSEQAARVKYEAEEEAYQTHTGTLGAHSWFERMGSALSAGCAAGAVGGGVDGRAGRGALRGGRPRQHQHT